MLPAEDFRILKVYRRHARHGGHGRHGGHSRHGEQHGYGGQCEHGGQHRQEDCEEDFWSLVVARGNFRIDKVMHGEQGRHGGRHGHGVQQRLILFVRIELTNLALNQTYIMGLN